jgi:CubicO group peptidase (beta-lactamase class C family)
MPISRPLITIEHLRSRLPGVALCIALSGCGDVPEQDTASAESPLVQASIPAPVITLGEVPGMALALVDERGLLWARGYGNADVDTHRSVGPDTAFWLASVTKTVTGTAIAHAMARGALSLDTDVSALLKRRAGLDIAVPDGAPITLRQLVTHTSAVRDSEQYVCSYYVGDARGGHQSLFNLRGEELEPDLFGAGFRCDEHAPVSLAGYLRDYLTVDGAHYTPDNFGPVTSGLDAVYSNVGAGLAGYALQLATGLTLSEYAQKYLFKPLRMRNTSFQLSDLGHNAVATPYAWDATAGKLVALPQYSLSTWPDGALRATAHDMARFLTMVMRGGELDGVRVMSADSVKGMITPLIGDESQGTGVFWDRFEIDFGRQLVGHSGGDPGATTFIGIDLDAGVGIVMLANTDGAKVSEVFTPSVLEDLFVYGERLHAARAH